MNLIVNGHRTLILGALSLNQTERLDDALSYEPRGAQFSSVARKFISVGGKRMYNKRFQQNFDPRVHLFRKRNNEFPTGLIPTVTSILGECEITSDFPTISLVKEPQIKTLRDYQAEVTNVLANHARGMVEVPTGGGKTVIISDLILRAPKDCSIVVTVPTVDLLYQTVQELKRFTQQEIGIYGDSEKNIQRITVSTIQSLTQGCGINKRTKRLEWELSVSPERINWLANVQYWISDEAHGAATESYHCASALMPAAMVRHGVTATLRREDNAELALTGVLGPCLMTVSPMTLVEQGHLCRPVIELHVYSHPSYRQGRTKPPYAELYKQAVTENTERTDYIRQQVKKLLENKEGPVLVLFDRLDHGSALKEALQDLGKVALINGSTETKSRQKLRQDVEDGLIDVAIASIVWVTGVNITRLKSLVVASAGRSGIMTVQRAGRVLRTHEGKSFARIIDICDDESCYLSDQYKDRRMHYYYKYPSCVKEITVHDF